MSVLLIWTDMADREGWPPDPWNRQRHPADHKLSRSKKRAEVLLKPRVVLSGVGVTAAEGAGVFLYAERRFSFAWCKLFVQYMTMLRWKLRLLLSKTNKSYNWICRFGLFCVFCPKKKPKLLFLALAWVVVAGRERSAAGGIGGKSLVTGYLSITKTWLLCLFLFGFHLQRRDVKIEV